MQNQTQKYLKHHRHFILEWVSASEEPTRTKPNKQERKLTSATGIQRDENLGEELEEAGRLHSAFQASLSMPCRYGLSQVFDQISFSISTPILCILAFPAICSLGLHSDILTFKPEESNPPLLCLASTIWSNHTFLPWTHKTSVLPTLTNFFSLALNFSSITIVQILLVVLRRGQVLCT